MIAACACFNVGSREQVKAVVVAGACYANLPVAGCGSCPPVCRCERSMRRAVAHAHVKILYTAAV